MADIFASKVGAPDRIRICDLCLRSSIFAYLADAAATFQLYREQALAIARAQIEVIGTRYDEVCDEGGLSEVDRNLHWRRQFLNPFSFDGAPAELLAMVDRIANPNEER